MSTDRWERVQSLFHEATELPEAELVVRIPSMDTLVNVSAKPRTETVRTSAAT